LADYGDPEIDTRIEQYEMAFKMQTSVPDLVDFSDESKQTIERYGPDALVKGTYANNCLTTMTTTTTIITMKTPSMSMTTTTITTLTMNTSTTTLTMTTAILTLTTITTTSMGIVTDRLLPPLMPLKGLPWPPPWPIPSLPSPPMGLIRWGP
jgi:hypothetical protein